MGLHLGRDVLGLLEVRVGGGALPLGLYGRQVRLQFRRCLLKRLGVVLPRQGRVVHRVGVAGVHVVVQRLVVHLAVVGHGSSCLRRAG